MKRPSKARATATKAAKHRDAHSTPLPTLDSGFVEVGKIVGAQGLKGEMRVFPDSDFPERFVQPGKRWLRRSGQAELQTVELVQGRYLDGKGLYVVRFAEIVDRTQAEALKDAKLLILAGDRPALEADEFHILDLIGLEVFDQATQTLIGTVLNIIPAGNDLLEVKPPVTSATNQNSVLIPFVKAIVPIVDLQAKRIEITPPLGLID